MAKFVLRMNLSLDGYVDHDQFAPDPVLFRHCWGGRPPNGIKMCQNEPLKLKQREPSVEQITRIGMDTSKHVFQLHGVDAAEQPVLRKKLRRKDVVPFFEKCPPTLVAIEACGASHHWARLLISLGHQVKLIAP